ncbi:MAG: diacylglycerol kinase [Betaproteobacteria bacterium]|nr:diacylglycerol kinase [Betaproteobacteria bacterium]MDE2048206.1 diacylglycerol kinase [Betaproteobacteria bacterium]
MESPYKGKTGLARLVQATRNSIDGFKLAYQHESAFRQEVWMAAVLLPVAALAPVDTLERLMLVGSVLVLLIVELLNSSVEAAIDRIGLERHELSKRAKDLGSAAVFVALVLLALTWGTIFFVRFVR